MKATQFIKDHGLERAREVVDGAPEYATYFELTIDGVLYFKYFEFSWFCFGDEGLINTYMDDYETCHLIDLRILKRLVESVDLITKIGGIENAKTFDEKCIYCVEHFTNLERLKQAIADYESIYGEGNE